MHNTFINNYTLDECTYHCTAYSVTTHPDDGQKWPKHVRSTNLENVYHLCILLVFINNYTTMHGVEHIKQPQEVRYRGCHVDKYFYYTWG
jgi:hypothetical protein